MTAQTSATWSKECTNSLFFKNSYSSNSSGSNYYFAKNLLLLNFECNDPFRQSVITVTSAETYSFSWCTGPNAITLVHWNSTWNTYVPMILFIWFHSCLHHRHKGNSFIISVTSMPMLTGYLWTFQTTSMPLSLVARTYLWFAKVTQHYLAMLWGASQCWSLQILMSISIIN